MNKKMTNVELKKKLDRLFKLKGLIDSKVKQIYQEHNDLTVEIAEEFCKRKGGEHADGILRTKLQIKFKGDDTTYVLIPNYMKDGLFRNVMWKMQGMHAFSIEKVELPF